MRDIDSALTAQAITGAPSCYGLRWYENESKIHREGLALQVTRYLYTATVGSVQLVWSSLRCGRERTSNERHLDGIAYRYKDNAALYPPIIAVVVLAEVQVRLEDAN